jgi:cytochrome c-type biogenesis protein CcmE
MDTYWKLSAGALVIIGVLVWLAMGGVTESKTYYKEIKEVTKMGDPARSQQLRGNGYVEPGSIVRDGARASFVLHQTPALRLAVVYTGIDPLTDTFKDNAQALTDGKLGLGRCLSCQQSAGEMRLQVRSQATSEDRRNPGHKPGLRKASEPRSSNLTQAGRCSRFGTAR